MFGNSGGLAALIAAMQQQQGQGTQGGMPQGMMGAGTQTPSVQFAAPQVGGQLQRVPSQTMGGMNSMGQLGQNLPPGASSMPNGGGGMFASMQNNPMMQMAMKQMQAQQQGAGAMGANQINPNSSGTWGMNGPNQNPVSSDAMGPFSPSQGAVNPSPQSPGFFQSLMNYFNQGQS